MHKKRVIFFAIVTAALSISTAHGRGDKDNKSTGCEQSAKKMQRACGYDARDDYYTMLANCENLSEKDARRECKSSASEARR